MKILLTNTLYLLPFSSELKGVCTLFCEDMVAITQKRKTAFHLKNDSIIFNCSHSVRFFFEIGFQPNENFQDKDYNRIYSVGQATKQELRKFGFGTYKNFDTEAELSQFIVTFAHQEHFVHFCNKDSDDLLKSSLPLQNIKYHREPLYKLTLNYPIVKEDYDAVVFFDVLEVTSFVKHNFVFGKLLFCMNKEIKKELQKYTNTKIYYSKNSDLDELLSLVKSFF